jgi:hypothetical protein
LVLQLVWILIQQLNHRYLHHYHYQQTNHHLRPTFLFIICIDQYFAVAVDVVVVVIFCFRSALRTIVVCSFLTAFVVGKKLLTVREAAQVCFALFRVDVCSDVAV